MIKRLFSWKWILTSILVVAAIAVMIRLGYWQLDRLEQRRTLNSRVAAQMNAEPLDLNSAAAGQAGTDLGVALYEMEYRDVMAVGEYDFSQEVALRNQAYEGRLGVHLLTPLRLEGSQQVILVDRGWISTEDYNGGDWSRFAEPGQVEVQGLLRRSRSVPDIGRQPDPTYTPGGDRVTAFYAANLERIGQQMDYEILPVYILQSPEATGEQSAPYSEELTIMLTEGSHQGYAAQWFTFAVLLGIGYPYFVWKEISRGQPEEQRNEYPFTK